MSTVRIPKHIQPEFAVHYEEGFRDGGCGRNQLAYLYGVLREHQLAAQDTDLSYDQRDEAHEKYVRQKEVNFAYSEGYAAASRRYRPPAARPTSRDDAPETEESWA